jgi:hypothetical protein
MLFCHPQLQSLAENFPCKICEVRIFDFTGTKICATKYTMFETVKERLDSLIRGPGHRGPMLLPTKVALTVAVVSVVLMGGGTIGGAFGFLAFPAALAIFATGGALGAGCVLFIFYHRTGEHPQKPAAPSANPWGDHRGLEAHPAIRPPSAVIGDKLSEFTRPIKSLASPGLPKSPEHPDSPSSDSPDSPESPDRVVPVSPACAPISGPEWKIESCWNTLRAFQRDSDTGRFGAVPTLEKACKTPAEYAAALQAIYPLIQNASPGATIGLDGGGHSQEILYALGQIPDFPPHVQHLSFYTSPYNLAARKNEQLNAGELAAVISQCSNLQSIAFHGDTREGDTLAPEVLNATFALKDIRELQFDCINDLELPDHGGRTIESLSLTECCNVNCGDFLDRAKLKKFELGRVSDSHESVTGQECICFENQKCLRDFSNLAEVNISVVAIAQNREFFELGHFPALKRVEIDAYALEKTGDDDRTFALKKMQEIAQNGKILAFNGNGEPEIFAQILPCGQTCECLEFASYSQHDSSVSRFIDAVQGARDAGKLPQLKKFIIKKWEEFSKDELTKIREALPDVEVEVQKS